MIEGGKIRMPRQDVAKDQKHGYIGEDSGEVEVIDRPEPGDSNAVPDRATAAARVEQAKVALANAERDAARADDAHDKATAKGDGGEKPPVGQAGAPKAGSKAADKTPDK